VKRYVGTLLAAVVAVAALLWPVIGWSSQSGSTGVTDPSTITDYRAAFDVAADGTLTATETLTVSMPPGRHGIFRFWDRADASDPHARLNPEDIAVTRDGHTEPVDLSWQTGRRYRVARIGDPNVVLDPGTHVYRISYRVRGALAGGDGGSVFYWNLVPSGWQMAIGQATVTAHLPAVPSGPVQCTVGQGAGRPCSVAGAGTPTLSVRTGALAPRTPVTVRARLPVPPPGRPTLPWSVRYDAVLGRSTWLVAVLAVLSAAALAAGFAAARRSREQPPGFPVMYEPPAGLGPAQTVYVVRESLPGEALVASLLHLAERKLVTLTPSGEKDRWQVEGVAPRHDWAGVDEVTSSVGAGLGVDRPGAVFRTDKDVEVESGERLRAAQQALPAVARRWALEQQVFVRSLSEARNRVLVYAAAVVAAVAIFWNPFAVTLLGLPFAAFAVGGFPLVLGGVGTRRTPAGRELWARAGGFERMLSTPSSEQRFDFSGRKELYTAFIPYAVAFGCADAWARKYETEMGEPPPAPVWFYGAGGARLAGSPQTALASFQTSLAASISAYQATQHGSSGGGFSGGGGGGGGGGGSW
jgi:uncharacterized membrane protein YgcG